MSVSSIVQATEEGLAFSLSSFKRGGQVYLSWSTRDVGVYSLMRWKVHSGALFSEVTGAYLAPFKNAVTILDPADDTLVVVYSDALEAFLYAIGFNPTTGNLVFGPARIGPGSVPSILYRGDVVGETLELLYSHTNRGGVYFRESLDGGRSWSGERPVLTNYVRTTSNVAAAALDDQHVSILQVGLDARPLQELGSFTRTRPVIAICAHQTLPDRYYVVEPSNYLSRINDNYRGGVLATVTATYYIESGDRFGTDDGIGQLSLFDTSGTAPVPVGTGAVSPTPITGVASHSVAVDLADSSINYYVAYSSDIETGYGSVTAYPFAGGSNIPLNGKSGAYAVAAALNVVAVAYLSDAQPVIELGVESGGGGVSWQAVHKMPARVNDLTLVMDSATTGDLLVSMVDRLNVYRINGLTSPIRLVFTLPVIGKGSFFQTVIAQNGNVVCAVGAGGVLVLSPLGGVVAQSVASGFFPVTWRPSTSYPLNSLVVPTERSVYSGFHKYFICTQPGTSGVGEPAWCPSSYGTVVDGGARWSEVGSVDAVVTGVALDQTRKRIYAVGVIGGSLGTTGRIYTFDATGLI